MNAPYRTLLVFFFSIVSFCVAVLPVYAQLNMMGMQQPLSIALSPRYPGPFEQVTARLSSSIGNIEQTSISWFLNGKLLERNIGLTAIQFISGDLGTEQVLQVVVDSDTISFNHTVTFIPAFVDLIIESEGYTPPFYRGKALNPYGSPVRVIAMPTFISPDGIPLNPNTLTYRWTKDGQVQGKVSGRGKNVYILENISITKGHSSIGLEVTSPDGFIAAGKLISVYPHRPEIHLYEDHPLLGIRYEHALGKTFELTGEEATLVAVPFFFSANNSHDPSLAYTWSLNRQTITGAAGTQPSLTIRQEGAGGRALIAVAIRNLKRIFESLQTELTVDFTDTDAL